MQKRGEIQRVRLGMIRIRTRAQHVGAPDHLVHRPEAKLSHQLTHFLGDEEEVVHYVLWLAAETRAQFGILRRDADGTRVEVTLPHHYAAFDDERRGREPEFIGAEQRADDYVAPGLELAVRLQPHAPPQAV